MAEQVNGLMKQLKKWVVNDYFTPNIKAEVILDMLLTPYVGQLLKNECGIDAVFLTKEMSLEEALKPSNDDRGSKIDYIFWGEDVYLVELKTTSGSIKAKQAKHYIDCCYDKNAGFPKSFGDVFGEKLLRILGKRYGSGSSWEIKTLEQSFFKAIGSDEEEDYAARASCYLRDHNRVSTYKYIYTAGQILDSCRNVKALEALWKKKLRLIYITPYGKSPHSDLLKYENFYIQPCCPLNAKSIKLQTAVQALKPESGESGGEKYLELLKDIIREIYGEEKNECLT